jgi:predicted transcriptional regulator
MRKSPAPRRTDEELIAAITARLEYKNGTKTNIADRANISHDTATRVIAQMLENGDIETYRAKSGQHVCDLYCLPGRRPLSAAPSALKGWANTLAAFREAVYGAVRDGRDPFKVAA